LIALPSPESRRGRAMERLIRVAQALQATRFGLSVADLVEEVRGVSQYQWHERTVLRDVELLECCGLAALVDVPGATSYLRRVRWIGRGGFFEQPATAAGLAADLLYSLPEPQEVA
jgi:predicted DNA-binding transcriptional regulator YafY